MSRSTRLLSRAATPGLAVTLTLLGGCGWLFGSGGAANGDPLAEDRLRPVRLATAEQALSFLQGRKALTSAPELVQNAEAAQALAIFKLHRGQTADAVAAWLLASTYTQHALVALQAASKARIRTLLADGLGGIQSATYRLREQRVMVSRIAGARDDLESAFYGTVAPHANRTALAGTLRAVTGRTDHAVSEQDRGRVLAAMVSQAEASRREFDPSLRALLTSAIRALLVEERGTGAWVALAAAAYVALPDIAFDLLSVDTLEENGTYLIAFAKRRPAEMTQAVKTALSNGSDLRRAAAALYVASMAELAEWRRDDLAAVAERLEAQRLVHEASADSQRARPEKQRDTKRLEADDAAVAAGREIAWIVAFHRARTLRRADARRALIAGATQAQSLPIHLLTNLGDPSAMSAEYADIARREAAFIQPVRARVLVRAAEATGKLEIRQRVALALVSAKGDGARRIGADSLEEIVRVRPEAIPELLRVGPAEAKPIAIRALAASGLPERKALLVQAMRGEFFTKDDEAYHRKALEAEITQGRTYDVDWSRVRALIDEHLPGERAEQTGAAVVGLAELGAREQIDAMVGLASEPTLAVSLAMAARTFGSAAMADRLRQSSSRVRNTRRELVFATLTLYFDANARAARALLESALRSNDDRRLAMSLLPWIPANVAAELTRVVEREIQLTPGTAYEHLRDNVGIRNVVARHVTRVASNP